MKEIVTDQERARRVERSLPAKLGTEAEELCRLAFLTCLPEKELAMGIYRLGGQGHAAGKAAAADGDQDGIHILQLLNDLQGCGSLAGQYLDVIEGMDVDIAMRPVPLRWSRQRMGTKSLKNFEGGNIMVKNILVPVDGSEGSDRAIEQAVTLASACGAKLNFLYVANINQLAINACLSDAILEAVTKAGNVILDRAMYGCRVRTIKAQEGPALGVAILAGVGAGIFPDVPTACRKFIAMIYDC